MAPTGKYACVERERKFLLPPMGEETRPLPKRTILDHYIVGTNLRLRLMENEGDKVYKLTKKTKLSPGREELTTIYLSAEEYELMSKLHAIEVSKIRFIAHYNDIIIGIDRYATEEYELWVAEVEFETDDDMNIFVMPLPFDKEVTGDDEFNGFTLANRFGFENRSS